MNDVINSQNLPVFDPEQLGNNASSLSQDLNLETEASIYEMTFDEAMTETQPFPLANNTISEPLTSGSTVISFILGGAVVPLVVGAYHQYTAYKQRQRKQTGRSHRLSEKYKFLDVEMSSISKDKMLEPGSKPLDGDTVTGVPVQQPVMTAQSALQQPYMQPVMMGPIMTPSQFFESQ